LSLADFHLVLLPGLDGTGKLFEPFRQQFPKSASITVINYPSDRHIAYSQLAHYLLPLLPRDKPLVVLGESYSGPVCLQLSTRDDLDIRAMLLVATFAKYPSSFLKSISRIIPISLLLRLPIPEFVIRYYCFGSDTNEALSRLLRQSIKENLPGVLAQRAREGSKNDVTGILQKINIPVLYIAATHDKMVPHQAIDDLKQHLPNMQVVFVEGTHFILQVQPKRCYDIVANFLSENIE